MRWLNDIRIKINDKLEVVTDVLQIDEKGLLLLTLVSHKKGPNAGVSTLVLIDSTGTAEEVLKQ